MIYIDDYSTITFHGNSTVNFLNNIADDNGGVMYIVYSSTITLFQRKLYCNNVAKGNGGVMYIDHISCLKLEERAVVVLNGK